MLIKLTGEQVARYWDAIKPCVEEALPVGTVENANTMNYVLEGLLRNTMHCWVSCDNKGKIFAIVVTTFAEDFCTQTRSLLIYSIFSLRSISDALWTEGFATLSKFAKGRGCQQILAYSANPQIVKVAKRYNADTSYTVIKLPLMSNFDGRS